MSVYYDKVAKGYKFHFQYKNKNYKSKKYKNQEKGRDGRTPETCRTGW